MDQTSLTLLERLRQSADSGAWSSLLSIYIPLLEQWTRTHRLQEADANDLMHEVVVVMLKRLPTFEHNGQVGAFRNWLRQIMINCLRSFWRRRKAAAGDNALKALADELEDPASGLSGQWEREHD